MGSVTITFGIERAGQNCGNDFNIVLVPDVGEGVGISAMAYDLWTLRRVFDSDAF